MSRRQGISFSLTIVVTGVILLMTALSLITLSGSSIQNFFATITSEQEEVVEDAEIREECQDLANQIDRNYCDQYVTENCNDPQPTRDTDTHTQTGTERGCELSRYAGGDFTVTVQGNEYDCQDEGHIGLRCPAG